jgi:glycosyltransferase involved in cell wall biosynthesis
MFAGDAGGHKGLPVLFDAWSQVPQFADLLVATPSPFTGTVPDRTRVIQLDPTEMASAWQRATIAVAPSVWADPFPTVILEAMSVGTAVVASNIGGIPEIVRDGVDGVLVEPGNVKALGSALTWLLGDHAALSAMGASARVRSKQFTDSTIIPRIISLYGQLIDGSRRQPS